MKAVPDVYDRRLAKLMKMFEILGDMPIVDGGTLSSIRVLRVETSALFQSSTQ